MSVQTSLTITNLTSDPVLIPDITDSTLVVPGSGSITLEDVKPTILRYADRLRALQSNLTLSLDLDLTDNFSSTPRARFPVISDRAVGADQLNNYVSNSPFFTHITLRSRFVAGGTADVEAVSPGALAGFGAGTNATRVMDALLLVSTAVGGSTVDLRDEAAGAGTLLGSFDTATTGRKTTNATSTTRINPDGLTKGLYLNRSDAGVAGELIITCRHEIIF